MARVSMNASVSWGRALIILSSCLIFATLIGLFLPHSGSGNLRSESGQQQQQNPTAGVPGMLTPKLPDSNNLLGPSVGSAKKTFGNRALGQADNFVWDGHYAFGAIQEHALDEVYFSYGFEASYSYDYGYYY